ncbi:MAG: UDP-N-acetylglucosamine 1-carboxyvinyltransferase [Clostridia bacterium]|nr:UDP-N-acetylglucosamine 1-carboxyvinyltransferase [Clostridia bacterium]
MSKIIIKGGNRLCGRVAVHGAKNSVLPIMAATVICNGVNVIHNCPEISDVETSIKILTHLGCVCSRQGSTVTVDSTGVDKTDIPEALMREMRSSIVFFGSVATRCGCCKLSSPGGCELGPRPIDLHISSLRELGLDINEDGGYLCGRCKGRICGKRITLSFPSVGATENIILTAATARGCTIICNAAREPEICDLQNFLNSAGADIRGAGSDTIIINGVDKLKGTEHTIIPDRIETATLLSAVAITGGRALITDVMPSHLSAVISVMREAGCEIRVNNNTILINAPLRLGRIPMLRTMCYPGFPTDAGPPILAMTTVAQGCSVFAENIFENRFRYVDELKRLGAKVNVQGKIAVIEGVRRLCGANVNATDLRGGAALAVAALAADGKTVIDKINYIDRGYQKIENSLAMLGADAVRI